MDTPEGSVVARMRQNRWRVLHQQVIQGRTEEESRVLTGRDNALMSLARGPHASSQLT
jgi:hypothetical protein